MISPITIDKLTLMLSRMFSVKRNVVKSLYVSNDYEIELILRRKPFGKNPEPRDYKSFVIVDDPINMAAGHRACADLEKYAEMMGLRSKSFWKRVSGIFNKKDKTDVDK